MQFKLRLIPAAAAAAALLAACGGGGGGDSAATGTPTSGKAVDGYLSLSKVVCDSNNNSVADTGEPITYTDIKGNFVFTTGCAHGLLVSGGTSADTGLEFVGQVRSPAGASVVTPLTTLMASGMTQTEVIKALGLPEGTNLLTTDPAATNSSGELTNASLMKKTLAVQQMLQKTTELFTGLGAVAGSSATTAVYTEVAAAFATKLKTGDALFDSSDTIRSSKVNTLVEAAVTRTSTATTVSADIKSALIAVGSANLAAVADTAITSQAQAIVSASNDQITAVTKDRQSNTSITNNVKTEVSAGRLSSNTSPAALETMKDAVAAKAVVATGDSTVSQIVPKPATGSTTLMTFDESTPAFSGMGAYGGALPTVEAGPESDAAKALKIAKPAGTEAWGGIYFGTSAVPFTADRKIITAAVYSTKANAVIKLKVQVSESDFVEVAGTATGAANTWGTVTWNLSGVNPAKQYTVMAITPDAETVASGQSYFIDNMALSAADASSAPTNYVYLDSNSIGFSANGSTSAALTYSMADFQSSSGGINIKWPMANAAALKLKLKVNGNFSFDSSQTLSAAVRIEEIGGGQGEIRAYTDKVAVSRSGDNITLSVPDLPQALIYGVSTNGKIKAVVDFSSKVRGITNTLSTASGAVSTVMFGEVVNYGITGLSNRFTNMSAMRGKYKVTLVVNELPLRKADGSKFDTLSIDVPSTATDGVPGNPIAVTGHGLVGYINLTD
jgi:hypothetical protein